jgi:hypothetical protein
MHQRGQEPASVSEATEQYREQMDVLGGFLEECCNVGTWLSDSSKRLYGAVAGSPPGELSHERVVAVQPAQCYGCAVQARAMVD